VTDLGGATGQGSFFGYVLVPAALVGAGIGALVGSSITVWAPAP
jgi:hypothetical protein